MRIAIVTTSWPATEDDPSGHFVRAEARELERGGHSVVVVAPTPGGAFGWPGVAARLRARPWRAWDMARWITSARASVARLPVDRVVAHWAVPCAWPVGLAARGAELEVVSHGSDARLIASLPRALRLRLVGTIASRACGWRFVSESLRDELYETLDDSTREQVERIARVQPAALEVPDARDAALAKRRALGAARVAVSVGRLVPGKRVDRAIDHVARSRDLDTLIVVGDGPERARLERLARTRGVDARFVGLVDRTEALAWIGAAGMLIQASEAEGASTVAREADALGARVVVV